MNIHQSILAVMLLLAAGSAAAHTETSGLGKDAGATDLFQVTCNDDGNGAPAYLATYIRGATTNKKAPLVSVQAFRDKQATNATDLKGGDATYSPIVKNNGGPGEYIMMVNKTKTGTVAYGVEYHCFTKADVHTGTEITTLQDQ
jgi:hypothetical protein